MPELRGRRAALAALLLLVVGLLVSSRLGPQSYNFSFSREQILLGTFVRIRAYGPDPDRLHQAVEAAFEEVRRIQEAFSRSGDGELARLNASAAQGPVKVSDEMWALLSAAQRYHALTEGAFDVTLGKVVDAWGFVEDWDGTGRVPSEEELEALLEADRRLVLDPDRRTVYFASGAVEVDLGGIAKGYAVDRALDLLRRYGVSSALVDAGGNVGVYGAVPERAFLFFRRRRPFRIAIQHPRRARGVLGTLELEVEVEGRRAVATSGDYQRFFMRDGVRYHHLIDPQTGRPARGAMSATVIAPTALEADALSTGVFVLGPDRGLALVERLPGVEAVIVTDAGEVLTSSGLAGQRFSY